MTESIVQKWLRNNVQSYPQKDRVFSDINTALSRFPSLRPKSDIYTFDDGRTQLLLCLHGLLPIAFRHASYNIPVALWLTKDYPKLPPISYVVPTADMLVKPGPFVDVSGKSKIEYTQHWERKDEGCNLLALLEAMQDQFSRDPPVYAKPKNHAPQVTASQTSTSRPTHPVQSPQSVRPALPPKPGMPQISPSPTSHEPTLSFQNVASGSNSGFIQVPSNPPPLPPHPPASSLPYHSLQPPHPTSRQSLNFTATNISSSPGRQYPSTGLPANPISITPELSQPPPPPPPPPPIGSVSPSSLPTYYQPIVNVQHPPVLSTTHVPVPNLLDGDPELQSSFGLPSAAPPPPRPPNPELLNLHEKVFHKLTSELGSLTEALALDAERLRAHQTDLLAGEPAIRDEMARLEAVRDVCRGVATRVKQAVDQADANVAELRRKGDPEVDELVCSTTIVYNQLINLVAEDNAIEDTIYHLHRALNMGRIDLERFLRTTRVLAEEQYMKRALIDKIQSSVPMGNLMRSDWA